VYPFPVAIPAPPPSRSTPDRLVPGRRDHEIAAIVVLVRSGLAPVDQLASILDQVGSAVEALAMFEAGQQPAFVERQRRLAALPADAAALALAEAGAWLAAGLDVRTVLDPEYPSMLHGIFNRPPLLFFAGGWDERRDYRSIAVVGTRHATPAGRRRARRLTGELAAAGYTILSGLALGIDAAAHEAALAAGGRTVAVVGTGLRRTYPPANADLARRILEAGGAIVSQFFPDQPPAKWTFPLRNVVMSGLALATVVVEAGETSGARMQARIALEHGRSVFLLRSLVAEHDWARRYVAEGAHGARAIEVASTAEILERLAGGAPATPAASGQGPQGNAAGPH
jgi:DNA processing protein